MSFNPTSHRRILFCVSGLLLLAPVAFCQDWNWQHPLPQGNTIWKCSFANDSTGFAVGETGTILFTDDGGSTWSVQYEGITDHLRGVWAENSSAAWAVGDNGDIFQTTNAGDSWVQQTSTSTFDLNGVAFADEQSGWVCGDGKTILHTINGGRIWKGQSVPALPGGLVPDLTSIACISKNEAWCVGVGGVVLHSIDGTNWNLQANVGTNISRIRMLDSLNGYIIGDNGLIRRTTNGGITWISVASPATAVGLNDIFLLSMSDFWVSGDNGKLLHTTSAGSAWTDESLNTYANINAIAVKNGVVTVFGEYGLLAAKNGSWSYVNNGQSRTVNWVSFSDSLHGIGCGRYGLILRTTDGGATWSDVSTGVYQYSYYGAKAKGNFAWIVGDLGWMYRSTDGGATWQAQPPTSANTLFSVDFEDSQNGWAVGDAGTILHTTDSGLHWTSQSSGTNAVLYGVTFTSLTQGWVVGAAGTLLHTTTGGASWSPVLTGVNVPLFNIEFPAPALGFIAGMNGTMLRSTDSGLHWAKQSIPTTRNLWVVKGRSSAALWCTADSGLVLFSTDAGVTWNDAYSNTSFDMFGLDVTGNNTVIIVGDNGSIVRNSMAPLTAVQQNPLLPRSFSMSQNYPNPFNPTTVISFSLPFRSFVTLTVFDLLGKKVAAIISEELPAGNYSRPWNAERYASGVYFYRLHARQTSGGQAGPFFDTKKLVLLR